MHMQSANAELTTCQNILHPNKNLPSHWKNPPLYPVKRIKHSIQLAPPHPDQLAKALDKHRTLDKRGGKKSN